jgi:hypothetical protein
VPLLVLVALEDFVPWMAGASAPLVALRQSVEEAVSEALPEEDALDVHVEERETANGL